MKNKVLRSRLEYWQTRYPNFSWLKDKGMIFTMIYLADITPSVSWLDENTLINFVDECVKSVMSMEKGLKYAETESRPELLTPVLGLIKKHRDKTIDSVISGKAEININGIKDFITRAEIIKHSIRTGRIITNSSDVLDIQKDLISYKKDLFSLSSDNVESINGLVIKSQTPQIHISGNESNNQPTQSENLRCNIKKYQFFKLPSVQQMSTENQEKLLGLMISNGIPYSIAMFDCLGFLRLLENDYFPIKSKLHREISTWFNVTERTIKGNLSVLSDYSKEDKERYTSHIYKEIVISDYKKLK